MADEPTPDLTTPPPPAAPAPQPAAPSFTQADLDRVRNEAARQAHDAAWAEARKRYAAKPSTSTAAEAPQARTEPTPTATPSTSPSPTDVAAQLSRMRAFDRALSRFELTDAARDLVEADFNRDAPSDTSAWLQARSEAFGWKRIGSSAPPATTNVTNQAPTASAAPTTPPSAMPGTTPPTTVTADTPLTSLGKSDLDAAIQRLGPHEFSRRWFAELARTGKRISVR